jgi:hypothetical protein
MRAPPSCLADARRDNPNGAVVSPLSDDYNRLAPHSALGMRSPADYRAVTSANRELPPLSSKLGKRSLPGRGAER